MKTTLFHNKVCRQLVKLFFHCLCKSHVYFYCMSFRFSMLCWMVLLHYEQSWSRDDQESMVMLHVPWGFKHDLKTFSVSISNLFPLTNLGEWNGAESLGLLYLGCWPEKGNQCDWLAFATLHVQLPSPHTQNSNKCTQQKIQNWAFLLVDSSIDLQH